MSKHLIFFHQATLEAQQVHISNIDCYFPTAHSGAKLPTEFTRSTGLS